MIRHCVRGFLDKGGADQYQFSGEHKYYKHVLERVYRPLLDMGLMAEYEITIMLYQSTPDFVRFVEGNTSLKAILNGTILRAAR
jgi:hypothetical protein